MGSCGVEAEPKDITGCRPEVMVCFDHDPGLHAGQGQGQTPDFLQRLIGEDCRWQRVGFIRSAEAQILRPDADGNVALAVGDSIAKRGQHQPRVGGQVN